MFICRPVQIYHVMLTAFCFVKSGFTFIFIHFDVTYLTNNAVKTVIFGILLQALFQLAFYCTFLKSQKSQLKMERNITYSLGWVCCLFGEKKCSCYCMFQITFTFNKNSLQFIDITILNPFSRISHDFVWNRFVCAL